MKPKGNKGRLFPGLNKRFLLFLTILITGGIILGLFSLFSGNNSAYELPTITLPTNPKIDPKEAAQLSDSCAVWYASTLENTNFNGGIIVAKSGNIVFERYKGETKLGSGIPLTDTTPIHIASVTKTFTAMAVLKLNQDKNLKLEDELSLYFPEFNYSGVTVQTLLNHRSGLPNYTAFMETSNWDKNVMLNNRNMFDYMIQNKSTLENIGNPDKHFSYCNTNYAVLALLIEKVSGMTYKDYIEKTFFQPLQMNHSFVRTAADSARVNPSYDWRGAISPDTYLDMTYGDKNIYSTPRDLLIWDKALRSDRIFTPETMAKAYTPYSNEKRGIRNYGLGWRMFLFPDGNKLIYHNGWWHGNNASFTRMIKEDATIIILGSRFNKSIYKGKELTRLFYQYQLEDDEE